MVESGSHTLPTVYHALLQYLHLCQVVSKGPLPLYSFTWFVIIFQIRTDYERSKQTINTHAGACQSYRIHQLCVLYQLARHPIMSVQIILYESQHQASLFNRLCQSDLFYPHNLFASHLVCVA